METDTFEEDQKGPAPLLEKLILDLDGYQGPLDVLLELARHQKVDLAKISILQLADQYLLFVERAKEERLELAADYLVMAAWLAYLKSRLLLPKTDEEDEPSGAEMSAALAFRLKRLQAMREAGLSLMARPQLGAAFHKRGMPEKTRTVATVTYAVSLYDVLKAYGEFKRREQTSVLQIRASSELYSVEAARNRLAALIGHVPEWRTLVAFLPENLREGLNRRSAIASTFAASLELAKAGEIQLRQDGQFGPIYVRGKRADGKD